MKGGVGPRPPGPLERTAKFAYRASQCIARLGFLQAVGYLVRSRVAGRMVQVRLPGVATPIMLRGATSDVGVFESVFMRGEYPLPSQERPRILDLGANAGFASLYFSLGCPGARILAVEPEPDNYALLVRNLGPYPLARCLQGAVWSASRTLYLDRVGQPADSITLEAPGGERATGPAVQAYGVSELIALAGFDRVDVLKMDVEGAEREIFARGSDDWLDLVDAIYIETHDRFAPGSTQALFRALAGRAYDVEPRGENLLIALRRDP